MRGEAEQVVLGDVERIPKTAVVVRECFEVLQKFCGRRDVRELILVVRQIECRDKPHSRTCSEVDISGWRLGASPSGEAWNSAYPKPSSYQAISASGLCA